MNHDKHIWTSFSRLPSVRARRSLVSSLFHSLTAYVARLPLVKSKLCRAAPSPVLEVINTTSRDLPNTNLPPNTFRLSADVSPSHPPSPTHSPSQIYTTPGTTSRYVHFEAQSSSSSSSNSRGKPTQITTTTTPALETVHPTTAASRHPINLPPLHTHVMAPKRRDKKGVSTSLGLFNFQAPLTHSKALQIPRRKSLLSPLFSMPTKRSATFTMVSDVCIDIRPQL